MITKIESLSALPKTAIDFGEMNHAMDLLFIIKIAWKQIFLQFGETLANIGALSEKNQKVILSGWRAIPNQIFDQLVGLVTRRGT